MEANAYLFFDGKCAEALALYGKLLDGEVESLMTYGESPMADQFPPETREKVMHARLRFGETIVMASDAPPGRYHTPQGFSVSIGFEDLDRARRTFDALAEGGSVTMPFEKTFWAAGFGMLVDRFGTPWMVSCEAAA
jgi:PhnB protein